MKGAVKASRHGPHGGTLAPVFPWNDQSWALIQEAGSAQGTDVGVPGCPRGREQVARFCSPAGLGGSNCEEGKRKEHTADRQRSRL